MKVAQLFIRNGRLYVDFEYISSYHISLIKQVVYGLKLQMWVCYLLPNILCVKKKATYYNSIENEIKTIENIFTKTGTRKEISKSTHCLYSCILVACFSYKGQGVVWIYARLGMVLVCYIVVRM